MGADRCTRITFVNPSALQTPSAPETVTAPGPLTMKSLPFAAIELQNIGSLKTSSSIPGAQPIGERLSIGVGTRGNTVTGKDCAEGIPRLQLSSKLLLSVPVSILMV